LRLFKGYHPPSDAGLIAYDIYGDLFLIDNSYRVNYIGQEFKLGPFKDKTAWSPFIDYTVPI
jgi:hypothetical protein